MSDFEIRDLVPGSRDENDYLQAGYDSTNRAVALFGEIPFSDLFTTDWEHLMPTIRANAAIAAGRGLIKNLPPVDQVLADLQGRAGLSFRSLLLMKKDSVSIAATELLVNLWLLWGVALPCLPVCALAGNKRVVTLDALVRAAPTYTYRSLFEVSQNDAGPVITNATKDALSNGVLSIRVNDRCCSISTTHCGFAAGRNCVEANGHCSIGSNDTCP